MNGEESQSHTLRDAGLAIFLGFLTYAGLALATGKVPLFGIPEEVTTPPYILLYSFLGGVAYLLSALLGEYKLLGTKKITLKNLKKGLEEQKNALEKRGLGTEEKKELSNVEEELKKVTDHLEELKKDWIKGMEIWIKFARIPFGMLMAAVFFLVAEQIVSEDILEALGPQVLAGGAFVVALFPKVIMEGLNGLAMRLVGKST